MHCNHEFNPSYLQQRQFLNKVFIQGIAYKNLHAKIQQLIGNFFLVWRAENAVNKTD